MYSLINVGAMTEDFRRNTFDEFWKSTAELQA